MNFKIPLLDDILKGMPDNARLRAQVTELHSKLSEAVADNKKLQEKIDRMKPRDDLLEEETEYMKVLFQNSGGITEREMAGILDMEMGKVEYYTDSLVEREMVDGGTYLDGERFIYLTPNGRKFLVEGGIV